MYRNAPLRRSYFFLKLRGVSTNTCSANIFLMTAGEALRIIGLAKRRAHYAGRAIVNERDACKAVVEALESFAPPNNLTFQVLSRVFNRIKAPFADN